MKLNAYQGKYSINTDREKLDIDFIHDYLCNQSYWARGRLRDDVEKSIKNSLCFGIYIHDQQIGFARIVTDYITFAWLCDVFIDSIYQKQGLGKWLIRSITSHPDMKRVKLIMLATSDAHELYRKYGGFKTPDAIEKWMVRFLDI
jgi:GNAT superfamily N-acetyltransferase